MKICQIEKSILEVVEEAKKCLSEKATKANYHFYVNSRPLLIDFISARRNLKNLKNPDIIKAYFAGRYDGDGSVNRDLRSDCRIVYGRKKEAKLDKELLKKIGISRTNIYYYKSANTFCLYIYRDQTSRFLKSILPYSKKLQKLTVVPRRD